VNATYEQLRAMILSQQLAPGQLLNEAELGRTLKVSRTPVREALYRLHAAGYLTQNGRGYTVVEVGEDDVIQVYRVRAVLEGLAAHEAAAVINRRVLGELEEIYEDMEEARAAGDDPRLTTLNSQFHHTIARASGNHYLVDMLDTIYDAFERFRAIALVQPGRKDNAAAEHGALIDALRARDGDRAREVAENHVREALAARQRYMHQGEQGVGEAPSTVPEPRA